MGIYLHVPFCRSKCFYCGFYSVATLSGEEAYLQALDREMHDRAGYLHDRPQESLYLGGGTPSLLSTGALARLLEPMEGIWHFAPGAERTLEANPEDLTREQVDAWRALGFNRLSIGIQSLSDARLKALNRRHTAAQALEGVLLAADAGFERISVDLMIGLPDQTTGEVERELERLLALPVTHLSVYMLSIDPGTVFEVRVNRREMSLPDEERLREMYLLVSDRLSAAGFDHYEISNFARAGHYARHNTAYWRQEPYLGLGPAAHSYDGVSRRWNTAHLKRYTEGVLSGTGYHEQEQLTPADLYNEYVMTGLRTRWGVEQSVLESRFSPFLEKSRMEWKRALDAGWLICQGDRIRMEREGWLLSDRIFSDLFVVI